jgi:hypothetical protein
MSSNQLNTFINPIFSFFQTNRYRILTLFLSILFLYATIIFVILPRFNQKNIKNINNPTPIIHTQNPKNDNPPLPPIIPLLNTHKNEVFHVGNNLFTYDESKALCKSYDSSLATYDQVVDAYKNGADWCSYGWSDNQMALFPTQKNTWDKLQKAPLKNKTDCGSIGINGGFFQDKNLKLGVNCYGVRKNQNLNKNLFRSDYISKKNLYQKKLTSLFKNTNSDFSILPHSRNNWSSH